MRGQPASSFQWSLGSTLQLRPRLHAWLPLESSAQAQLPPRTLPSGREDPQLVSEAGCAGMGGTHHLLEVFWFGIDILSVRKQESRKATC